jgi:ABC-type nitrate/sulfonate/bicarbonate transport system substrate-binding protein
VYAAEALGLYAAAGLAVEIVSPPEDGAMALIGSGKAEIGVDFQESLGQALASNTPLPVTAVAAMISHNTAGIVSLASAGITSPSLLEGKRFATWNEVKYRKILGALMETSARAAGTTPGDPARVQYVSGDVTDVESALATTIDAVCVYEGWDVVKMRLDGVAYNYIDIGKTDARLDHYSPVIVASDAFLRDAPERARAFMAATAAGYRYAMEHPDEAAAMLVAAVPELDPVLVQESQRFLATKYQGDSPAWGYIDGTRWAGYYRWAFEQGILRVELGERGFTNDFLPVQ